MNISFTSTYQINLIQQGVKQKKRERLIDHVKIYYPNNSQISNSHKGTVKVSMDLNNDARFEQRIKDFGFKVFKKFPVHNVAASDLESVIARHIKRNDFVQKGRQKRPNR